MEKMMVKINDEDAKLIAKFKKMSGLYKDEVLKKIFKYGIEELETRYHFELEDFEDFEDFEEEDDQLRLR